MKYCDGLDCTFCQEKEPCIYRIANKLQQCIDNIEEYCNKYGQNSIGFKKNILALIKQAKEGGE